MTHKTLAEMTPEEAAPIMEAWRKGEPLEVLTPLDWFGVGPKMELEGDGIYRLPVTKDEVPWHVFPPEVQWYARDENGLTFLYTDKPFVLGRAWDTAGDMHELNSNLLAGHTIGTCDWRDSRQQRPEASQ